MYVHSIGVYCYEIPETSSSVREQPFSLKKSRFFTFLTLTIYTLTDTNSFFVYEFLSFLRLYLPFSTTMTLMTPPPMDVTDSFFYFLSFLFCFNSIRLHSPYTVLAFDHFFFFCDFSIARFLGFLMFDFVVLCAAATAAAGAR